MSDQEEPEMVKEEPSNEVVVDPKAPPSPNVDHPGAEHEKWSE